MKKWMALLLCGVLLCAAGGCRKTEEARVREDSAGTGYGVSQKSALIMQDLYILKPGLSRDTVQESLGSPQTFVVSESNNDTYRLTGGETVELQYSKAEKLETAVYTDSSGVEQDFFQYLSDLGILKSYTGSGSSNDNPSGGSSGGAEENGDEDEAGSVPGAETSYFSTERYSYELAEEILELGVQRETVVSALGKPNSFSSITFEKDSYLIDVYIMEDGSSLYLDYGYNRSTLRAVRRVSGTTSSSYLGTWGQEEKPEGFIRMTRSQALFNTLQRNAKPSELYRRFGEPDWLEGSATHYRDAYQLLDGAVFYLDFGADHAGLTAAVLIKSDGTIVNYTLR